MFLLFLIYTGINKYTINTIVQYHLLIILSYLSMIDWSINLIAVSRMSSLCCCCCCCHCRRHDRCCCYYCCCCRRCSCCCGGGRCLALLSSWSLLLLLMLLLLGLLFRNLTVCLTLLTFHVYVITTRWRDNYNLTIPFYNKPIELLLLLLSY